MSSHTSGSGILSRLGMFLLRHDHGGRAFLSLLSHMTDISELSSFRSLPDENTI